MIEHLIKEGKAKANTAEGRVINAAYQAMNTQIEAEGLKDPDAMVASLDVNTNLKLTHFFVKSPF